ncbi:MAG: FAD-binding protein [Eubacteriales bacterium]|nr:FAD-binding protein [Eubacteriales bacterium]
MKLLLCLKQVPDTAQMRWDSETNTLDRSRAAAILNPFDAFALELALSLKEQAQVSKIVALSMGPAKAEEILRHALSLGVDEAYLLTDRKLQGSDSLVTSRALAACAKELGPFSCILVGKQSIDGDTAQVGPQIAEFLNLPHLSRVVALEALAKQNKLLVKAEDDYALSTYKISTPCLLTVDKFTHEPRTPSLKAKLAARKKTVHHLSLEDIKELSADSVGLKASPTKVKKVFTPKLHSRGRTALEDSPEALAKEAFSFIKGALSTPETRAKKKTLERIKASSEREVWVLLENLDCTIREHGFELLSLAQELSKGSYRTVAIKTGDRPSPELSSQLNRAGADALIMLEGQARPNILELSETLAEIARKKRPLAILVGASTYGRSLAPRLAAKLATGLVADCTGVTYNSETELFTWIRPACSGNLYAEILCPDQQPQMASIRPQQFLKQDFRPKNELTVESFELKELPPQLELVEFEAFDESSEDRSAEVVIAVGRGADQNTRKLAEKLADILGARLMASRPLVDQGLFSHSRQVGQTGQNISPKLYIALGISGAAQHLVGIQHAKKILAVNKDADAPIKELADLFIPAKLEDFLPAILEALARESL